ncbi:MAG: hypothetical protein A3B89_01755 [Candidatus Buchananbacteria bacterium RIFCSPHIGHO2_02_FULL_40_13]|uniref:Uncharacterized protein n=1 Tax=Candidatus Buchananbacteria bacterium RIFCSPLOWO2_01_FULL_39_33 TaxID=1797543 RepID=A0A1G1YKR3_9BACT|nr:MAG: hypothetical protein A3B89_01755 [Candidatus Buchananbacteria bacterium RIFCSPHIGHO2_02_FULL_40_13]OGY52270.1 MAG: hypothetical protein A3A02_01710 [Candidatus Buchananbacteria bacterium RIFCSPLOWO2_01_FULL_39_33]
MTVSKLTLAVKSFRTVFGRVFYFGLVFFLFLISLLVNFLISAVVLNYDLLIFTLTSGLFSFKTQAGIFFSALASVAALPLISLTAIIILSALLAIEISLFIFYFKKQLAFKRETGLGFSAIAVSFLGLGCSACGSLILSSLIGLTATTAVIDWLPLEGLEFGLLGIFILLLAIYLTAYKISAPNDCKV